MIRGDNPAVGDQRSRRAAVIGGSSVTEKQRHEGKKQDEYCVAAHCVAARCRRSVRHCTVAGPNSDAARISRSAALWLIRAAVILVLLRGLLPQPLNSLPRRISGRNRHGYHVTRLRSCTRACAVVQHCTRCAKPRQRRRTLPPSRSEACSSPRQCAVAPTNAPEGPTRILRDARADPARLSRYSALRSAGTGRRSAKRHRRTEPNSGTRRITCSAAAWFNLRRRRPRPAPRLALPRRRIPSPQQMPRENLHGYCVMIHCAAAMEGARATVPGRRRTGQRRGSSATAAAPFNPRHPRSPPAPRHPPYPGTPAPRRIFPRNRTGSPAASRSRPW